MAPGQTLTCRTRPAGQCAFLGYLATDMQVETMSSPSDHHCSSQTFIHRLPAGSTHLKTPTVQVWSAYGCRGDPLPAQPGVSPKLSGVSAQPSSQVKTAPLTLWERSPAQSSWVLQAFCLSAAKPSSLRIWKEGRQTKGKAGEERKESSRCCHTSLSTLGGHLEEVLGEAGR